MKTKLTPEERRLIATKLDMSPAYLWQCLAGVRDIDPTEAVRIERETGGLITRFDVCRKRGQAIWPELYAQRSIYEPEKYPQNAIATHVATHGTDGRGICALGLANCQAPLK